jgi:hypothetical protein
MPMDYDTRASYSVLSLESDEAKVRHHRVPYKTEQAICDIEESDMMKHAFEWAAIYQMELRDAHEYSLQFLDFAEMYAVSINDTTRPICAYTWEKAFSVWPLKYPLSQDCMV